MLNKVNISDQGYTPGHIELVKADFNKIIREATIAKLGSQSSMDVNGFFDINRYSESWVVVDEDRYTIQNYWPEGHNSKLRVDHEDLKCITSEMLSADEIKSTFLSFTVKRSGLDFEVEYNKTAFSDEVVATDAFSLFVMVLSMSDKISATEPKVQSYSFSGDIPNLSIKMVEDEGTIISAKTKELNGFGLSFDEELSKMRDENIEKMKNVEETPLVMDVLNILKNTNSPIELIGSAGVGKTITGTKVAAMLNMPSLVYGVDATTDKFALFGGQTQVKEGDAYVWKWQPNGVSKIIQEGGVLVLDEWSTGEPEAITAINALLDGTGYITAPDATTKIKVHESFRLICTSNVGYNGVKHLNEATNNRFIQLLVSQPQDRDIITWLKNDGYLLSAADELSFTNVYKKLSQFTDENKEFVFSYRNMEKFASLYYKAKFSSFNAAKASIFTPMFRNSEDALSVLSESSSIDELKRLLSGVDNDTIELASVLGLVEGDIKALDKIKLNANKAESIFNKLNK